MKIFVKDLFPNPFRDLARYPVQREKIEALKQSIKNTSFWDNLLARETPNGGGGYEIAYGHNRLTALRELGVKEVDIPVRALDDTEMARIMAHENMEEWGATALVEQETVRAVVLGYAEGRIKLSKPNHQGLIRYAPSFNAQEAFARASAFPYTNPTLADFLDWKEWKIQATLEALAATADGLIHEADLKDLSTRQTQEIVIQAHRVEKEQAQLLGEGKARALAKTIASRLAEGMRTAVGIEGERIPRSGHHNKKGERMEVTLRNAKFQADVMVGKQLKPKGLPAPIPDVEDFIAKQVGRIGQIGTVHYNGEIEKVIECKEDIPSEVRKPLANALRRAADRLYKFADRVDDDAAVESPHSAAAIITGRISMAN